MPVSYTHLDVYKRQKLQNLLMNINEYFSNEYKISCMQVMREIGEDSLLELAEKSMIQGNL